MLCLNYDRDLFNYDVIARIFGLLIDPLELNSLDDGYLAKF